MGVKLFKVLRTCVTWTTMATSTTTTWRMRTECGQIPFKLRYVRLRFYIEKR